MLDIRSMHGGVIKRLPDGDLRVTCPDGSIQRVAAHRPDLAQWLASGVLDPRRCTGVIRVGAAKASALAAPAASGFTRDQVHALGDMLRPLVRPMMARLDALEGKKAKAKAKPMPSTCVEVAQARAAVAQARAAAALHHAP